MPERIVIRNDDGTEEEREFFTAEDLAAKEAETKSQYESRLQEMEKDVKPDWREVRKQLEEKENRIKMLEKTGKTINDSGEVVEMKPEISYQDIEDRARAAARSEQMNFKKEEYLSQYDEETRKVVEHMYNKLTAGEQVTVASMEQYINQAEMLAIPNRGNVLRSAVSNSRGISPSKAEPVNFSDTDNGKGLADSMGLKYAYRK